MRTPYNQLLKVVQYGEIDTLSEDFVCDMLSCLTLHRPYPNNFHKEMLKIMHDSMERYEDQVSLWKTAHTHMFDRIQQELSSSASRKKTDEMLACLMSSVGQVKLQNQAEVREYILGGLEWVFQDWQGMRKGALLLSCPHARSFRLCSPVLGFRAPTPLARVAFTYAHWLRVCVCV